MNALKNYRALSLACLVAASCTTRPVDGARLITGAIYPIAYVATHMAFYDEARVARGKGDLSLFPKFLAFIMAFGTFKRSYSSKPEDFLGVGLSISALAGIVYWAKNHGTTKDIKKYGKRLWSSVTYAAKVAVSGFALGRVFGGDAPGDNTSRTYLRYSEESGDLIIEEVD